VLGGMVGGGVLADPVSTLGVVVSGNVLARAGAPGHGVAVGGISARRRGGQRVAGHRPVDASDQTNSDRVGFNDEAC
jgi:hypothetical protein